MDEVRAMPNCECLRGVREDMRQARRTGKRSVPVVWKRPAKSPRVARVLHAARNGHISISRQRALYRPRGRKAPWHSTAHAEGARKRARATKRANGKGPQ